MMLRLEELSWQETIFRCVNQFIVGFLPRERVKNILACKLLMKISKAIAVLRLKNCRLIQSTHLVNNKWSNPITSLISIH